MIRGAAQGTANLVSRAGAATGRTAASVASPVVNTTGRVVSTVGRTVASPVVNATGRVVSNVAPRVTATAARVTGAAVRTAAPVRAAAGAVRTGVGQAAVTAGTGLGQAASAVGTGAGRATAGAGRLALGAGRAAAGGAARLFTIPVTAATEITGLAFREIYSQGKQFEKDFAQVATSTSESRERLVTETRDLQEQITFNRETGQLEVEENTFFSVEDRDEFRKALMEQTEILRKEVERQGLDSVDQLQHLSEESEMAFREAGEKISNLDFIRSDEDLRSMDVLESYRTVRDGLEEARERQETLERASYLSREDLIEFQVTKTQLEEKERMGEELTPEETEELAIARRQIDQNQVFIARYDQLTTSIIALESQLEDTLERARDENRVATQEMIPLHDNAFGRTFGPFVPAQTQTGEVLPAELQTGETPEIILDLNQPEPPSEMMMDGVTPHGEMSPDAVGPFFSPEQRAERAVEMESTGGLDFSPLTGGIFGLSDQISLLTQAISALSSAFADGGGPTPATPSQGQAGPSPAPPRPQAGAEQPRVIGGVTERNSTGTNDVGLFGASINWGQ